MSVFNNDNNNNNDNHNNPSIADTTNIRINTTNNNFKLLKHSRNQSFADIIRIALEKREEIYQQQSELELSDQIHLARLSQRGKAAAVQAVSRQHHQTQQQYQKDPRRRSYSTDNLSQFINTTTTTNTTNMPFTEKRKSSKYRKTQHKPPQHTTSLINLKGVGNIGENELRQEVHDLLDEVENKVLRNPADDVYDGDNDDIDTTATKTASIRTKTTSTTNENMTKTIYNRRVNGMSRRETVVELGGLELPMSEGELSEIERIYLYAAEQGDLATIKQLTDESVDLKLNLNCTDTLGRDVLRIAIENEHMELLQFLVAIPALDLKDCLLHAINEDNVSAVEIILQAQNERASKKDLRGLLGRFQSSMFTPDINGIILAAHRDNYVILKLLLDRGDRIPKPHDLRCACNLCTQARREDGLQHSKLRINTYRALTSPSFIILTSNDPILTAFELSWELKKLGQLENEFRSDYEEMEAKCQQFATDMLAQTRSSAELSVVLNHDTGGDSTGCHVGGIDRQSYSGDISERMQLSRLKLAIRYEQKKFVAHPHCQQLLAAIWYEGLPGFRQKPMFAQLTTIGVLCSMFPILATFYMLAPHSKMGSMMKKPFIKFLCHSSSYLSFLALLTLAAIRVEFLLTNSMDQRMHDRGPPPSLTESALIIYVIGFVWQQMKKLYIWGLRAHLTDMWNLVDFVMNSLYISTISLRTVAWARTVFYDEPRYVNRGQWDSFDPVLVSECLFAAANIVSTLKLVYVFTVSPQLGPLQISLGRMLYDIFRFFCVYFLVLVAFAFGFNQLYWFYAKNRARNCKNVHFTLEEGQKDVYDYCITRGTYFTNLFEIVQSLYWSAYGLIDLTSFNLEYPHVFTEFVGKLTFGTYSYIAFIVLLNMLIAMMNSSYEQIVGQVDVEWKFARSKLWISFFGEGCTVPVPFNIIPTPKSFMYMMNSLKKLFLNCYKEKLHRNNWETVRQRVKQVKEREARYQVVMRELTKRYIMYKLKSGENETVSPDDLSEIKGDISAFRHELLDILKSNGMKIPNYHKKVSKLRRGRDNFQISEIQEMVRGKKSSDSMKQTSERHFDEDKVMKPSKPLLGDKIHSLKRRTPTSVMMSKSDMSQSLQSNNNNDDDDHGETKDQNVTDAGSGGGPVDNPAFEGEEIIGRKKVLPGLSSLGKSTLIKSVSIAGQEIFTSDITVQPIIHPNVTPCTSTIVCEETLDCTTTTTTADHNLVSVISPPPRPPTQQPTTSQSLFQPSVEIIKPSLDKAQGAHETGVKPDFKKMTDAIDAKHSAETKKSALKQGNVVAEGKVDIQVEPLKTSTDDKKVKQRKKMADIQQTPQLLDKRSDFV